MLWSFSWRPCSISVEKLSWESLNTAVWTQSEHLASFALQTGFSVLCLVLQTVFSVQHLALQSLFCTASCLADSLFCTVSCLADKLFCTLSCFADRLFCMVSCLADRLFCTVSCLADRLFCTVSCLADRLFCTVSCLADRLFVQNLALQTGFLYSVAISQVPSLSGLVPRSKLCCTCCGPVKYCGTAVPQSDWRKKQQQTSVGT